MVLSKGTFRAVRTSYQTPSSGLDDKVDSMPEFGNGQDNGKRESRIEIDGGERANKAAEVVALAKELIERNESFPFPSIDPDALSKMRAIDNEFPHYVTPVDTLLDRCRTEGIRVTFGKYPESGNVYIVPAGENEMGNENMRLLPRHLQVNEMMDRTLRALIIAERAWFNSL